MKDQVNLLRRNRKRAAKKQKQVQVAEKKVDTEYEGEYDTKEYDTKYEGKYDTSSVKP